MRKLCKEIAFNNSLQRRGIFHYIRRNGLINLKRGLFLTRVNRESLGIK
jgi:hypothetical protein